MASISAAHDHHSKSFSGSSRERSSVHYYFIIATCVTVPLLSLLLLTLLEIQVAAPSLFAPCPLSRSQYVEESSRAGGSDHSNYDRLRDSVTFLPLKDPRFAANPQLGKRWFMSSMNDSSGGGDVDGTPPHLYFPSEASKGRLLCLSARHISDGAENSYSLAWPDALPRDATLLPGLTFVADNFYDYHNLWHGNGAVLPFVMWRLRKDCAVPDRWILFHWGELRTSMGPWVQNLTKAAIGEAKIEDLRGYGDGPACFERAVVFRNEGNMDGGRRREVLDMMRCRARAYCGVAGRDAATDSTAVHMTLLLRKGARSFKDEAKVIGIFEKECEKVDGCRLKAAWGDNMTFCDQVSLMSETDVLVSPHGCQLTNLFLMEKNSSVMEFYPKGWLENAGVGQYIYQWMAGWSGMQHRGSWRDPEGEDCLHADRLRCFSLFKDKQIGHDAAYFADWAAKVLGEAKEYKLSEAWRGNRQAEAPIQCPCQ